MPDNTSNMEQTQEKKCTKCNHIKPSDNFHKQTKTHNGLQSWCKECHETYIRQWNKENKSKKLKTESKYRNKHKEKIREYQKNHYYANLDGNRERARNRRRDIGKEASWEAWIKYKYGISAEIYYAMLDSQGGVCAICKSSPENKKLAIDHDHKTGRVRGLLCAVCNKRLGIIESFMDKALEYLETTKLVDASGQDATS